jgi:hypothetical protein
MGANGAVGDGYDQTRDRTGAGWGESDGSESVWYEAEPFHCDRVRLDGRPSATRAQVGRDERAECGAPRRTCASIRSRA